MKEEKKIELENALKQRNFEIDLFWKRSWFFGALTLALISGYYKLKTDTNQIFPPVTLSFIISLTTLFQCLMNRGSKYWQERWEYITMNKESAANINITKLKKFEDTSEHFYIHASILNKNENFLARSRRFSVSKLTILVWDIICLTTVLIWLNDSISIFTLKPDWPFTIKLIVFYMTLGGYILLFWIKGKVFESFNSKIYIQSKLDELDNKYINNTFK